MLLVIGRLPGTPFEFGMHFTSHELEFVISVVICSPAAITSLLCHSGAGEHTFRLDRRSRSLLKIWANLHRTKREDKMLTLGVQDTHNSNIKETCFGLPC